MKSCTEVNIREGFGPATYLVRRAPGPRQATGRAAAKSFPTSLLRDPGGRETGQRVEKQQPDDTKMSSQTSQSRGDFMGFSRRTSQVKA